MVSQFLRLQGYGAGPRRGAKPYETARDVIAEAGRLPGSTPHIRRPKPAVQLYGTSVAAIVGKLEDVSKRARDGRGAKLRMGAIQLYAIVASYPVSWRAMDLDGDRKSYQLWRTKVVDWLHDHFGDQLEWVVEHVDEKFPHLHAIVFPRLDRLNRIDHSAHPGYRARSVAAAAGADHKQCERAYRRGMREWQDDFHQAVSSHFGHARIGPRRQRFRRDAALSRRGLEAVLERADHLACSISNLLEAHVANASHPGTELQQIRTLIAGLSLARNRLATGHGGAMDDLEAMLEALCAGSGNDRRTSRTGYNRVMPLKQGAEDHRTLTDDRDDHPGFEDGGRVWDEPDDDPFRDNLEEEWDNDDDPDWNAANSNIDYPVESEADR